MDNLVSLLKAPVNQITCVFLSSYANSSVQAGINVDVKSKMIEEIQTWALAFEGRPHLSYVKTIYTKLKSEGFQFPEAGPVSASFVDSSAVRVSLVLTLTSFSPLNGQIPTDVLAVIINSRSQTENIIVETVETCTVGIAHPKRCRSPTSALHSQCEFARHAMKRRIAQKA